MKKYFLVSLLSLSLFTKCQNNWQTINYNGVSVQLPTDWGSKNTINHYGETNITEYQISCWSKNNNMSLAIQWVDTIIENDLYINILIENLRETIYRQFHFDEILNIDYLGFNAKKCHFSGNLSKDVYGEGECIAFTNNKNSFIVFIMGDKDFYKSSNYNYILNSIEPNFISIGQPKEKKVQTSATDFNFTRYEFREYSLSIPNTMELRNENSFMSIGKEIFKDKIKSIKKIDIGDVNFVFQPTGTEDVQNSERQKKALSLYSRVLINYQKDNNNSLKWDDDITYTEKEYNEINKYFRDNLLSEIKDCQKKGMNFKILNISDIAIKKNSNKFVYIKQSYIRSGINGNVKVIDYYIYNNNEVVKLTISYRVSESYLWEADFNKIIDSFSFNTKK